MRPTRRTDLRAPIGGSPDRSPRSRERCLGCLRPASLLAYVFLGGFLVAMLFPIYWIIVSSVKTRIDTLALPPVWLFAPTLEAYRRVFIDEHYGRYFVNTAVIAAATTLISLAVGSMAAYVLDRFRVRFSA